MKFSPYQKSRAINYGIGSTSEKQANVARLRAEYAKNMSMSLEYEPNAKINGETRRVIARKTEGNQRCEIQSAPGETFYAGDIVECYGSVWIIIEVEANKDIYTTGTMLRCNHNFKFQNGTSEIYERWGVLDTGVYSTTVQDIDTLTILNKQYKIYLPLDEYTSQLYIGKRFATSTMKDAYYHDVLVVYRTTEFDDSSENYGEDKLLVMKCVSDQYNPEKDNFDLMICDYIAPDEDESPDAPSDEIVGEIKYSGDPVVRIGGTGKTFTVEYTKGTPAEGQDPEYVADVATVWSLGENTPEGIYIESQDNVSCRVVADDDVADGTLVTLTANGTKDITTTTVSLVVEAVIF